jgi:hypothetical protein
VAVAVGASRRIGCVACAAIHGALLSLHAARARQGKAYCRDDSSQPLPAQIASLPTVRP